MNAVVLNCCKWAETKVGMAKLKRTLNYHIYEHVGFIIGLKDRKESD